MEILDKTFKNHWNRAKNNMFASSAYTDKKKEKRNPISQIIF